ncbi:MerR family transcriptional regulator [Ramlibacter albus]|uniref:Cobalamin B12-binding domain-containing protein n=1 Tax=Ramlibacter albus TaxID=2079448 RepID=A0A923MDZ5_9BURK|nr:cobalamin-dependent protein [Ramlibacter albus]MBC5767816.1 cobalamin B12-binding domain-containing protein [Ramlibacter albus]
MARALLIEEVEAATAIPRATLRVWEQRYGIPGPSRNEAGRRSYSLDEVEYLKSVASLVRRGARPKQLLAIPRDEVHRRARAADREDAARVRRHPVLSLMKAHDVHGLRAHLRGRLLLLGISGFVDELATTTQDVGSAWQCGGVSIFEEHAFTECVENIVREALSMQPAPPAGAPRVLLATLEGEHHRLGLLFAQAVLVAEGCDCISLGPNVPSREVARAAKAYECRVIALSSSAGANSRKVKSSLGELVKGVQAHAPGTAVWFGANQAPPRLLMGQVRHLPTLQHARLAARELLGKGRRTK